VLCRGYYLRGIKSPRGTCPMLIPGGEAVTALLVTSSFREEFGKPRREGERARKRRQEKKREERERERERDRERETDRQRPIFETE